MKTSFCTNVFSPEEMEKAIINLSYMGYDALEFWDQYLRKVDISWLVDRLQHSRIEVSQICPYFNFTGSKEDWEKSIKIAGRYIGLAKKLNTKLIRVFTGKVGSEEATKKQWKAGVEGLKKICAMGKEEGITFVLETHPGSLMDTSKSTLRILEEVGMDNLKVNLQVPLKGEEDPLISAEKLGRYTVHLHAHNWKYLKEDYTWGELTFLDSGCYDFEKFIRILHSKGFNGYISIEHADHNGLRNPYKTAQHEIKYLKDIITGMQ